MKKPFINQIGFLLIVLVGWKASAIVKGDVVPTGRQTETVFISTNPNDMTFESCTGVVVAPNLILTAAHCVEAMGTSTSQLTISNSASRTNSSEIDVAKMKAHPRHMKVGANGSQSSANIQYDIAYILVKENLNSVLNGLAYPLIPGQSSDVVADLNTQNIWAVGYGYSTNSTPNVDTINKYKRELNLGSMGSETVDNYFVMKSNMANEGLCRGDSGSGLFVRTSQGSALLGILSGIASYDGPIHVPADCGKSKVVGAYVALYHHLCWLKQETGLQLSSNVTCN